MKPGNPTDSRIQNLDILRALAVVLVLVKHFFHLRLSPGDFAALDPIRPLMRAGWIGVPIFFVLSGYLIGHLLFREYATTGTVGLKRFWIRRGFKIYPPFYLVILVYSAYLLVFEGHLDMERFFCEIFFIQNYGKGGLIDVTWSLAVEEHFYVIFPLFLLLLIKCRPSDSLPRETDRVRVTFRPILLITALLMVGCLLMRLEAVSWPVMRGRGIMMTHLRIDALFAGAAMAYMHQVHPGRLLPFFKRHAVVLTILAALLTYPAFLPEITYGKVFYLGWFSLILTVSAVLMLGVALSVSTSDTKVARVAAWLGTYSYGIYLCHVPVYRLANKIAEWLPHRPHVYIWVPLSAALACVVGIVLTRLVEFPMLRVRDRYFPRPARTQPTEVRT